MKLSKTINGNVTFNPSELAESYRQKSAPAREEGSMVRTTKQEASEILSQKLETANISPAQWPHSEHGYLEFLERITEKARSELLPEYADCCDAVADEYARYDWDSYWDSAAED